MIIPELDPVPNGTIRLATLPELRHYVKWTLCRQENLDPTQFAVSEVLLKRAGQPCGLCFRLRGPRAVTLQAIWAAGEQLLFFYDSAGNRFLRQHLQPGSEAAEELLLG